MNTAKKSIEELIEKKIAEALEKKEKGGRFSPKKHESFKERWGEEIARFGFIQVPRILTIARELTPNEKVLLSVILSFDKCFITDKKLSEILGVSRPHMTMMMKSLEEKGWIKRVRKMDKERGYFRRWIDTKPAKNKMLEMIKSENCELFASKTYAK